jgi:peroxiredoxin
MDPHPPPRTRPGAATAAGRPVPGPRCGRLSRPALLPAHLWGGPLGKTYGVGREAPLFTLPATAGGEVSLRSYRGDWLPVLVFVRHDAPDAGARLKALGGAAGELWGYRGQLLVVAAAPLEDLQALEQETGPLAYPLLADAGGAVARAYGLWSARAGAVDPTACIVDRSGKIVWSGRGDDLRPQRLLRAFRDIVR